MNKKIMSIDELYSFCLKNKFINFDSEEEKSEIAVEMHGDFEKSESEEKHAENLSFFVSRAFHDKVNLNKSSIETDVFKENLPSAHLRPILANIIIDKDTGEKDFGSHDGHVEKIVETADDGSEVEIEKYVYDEQPIGVIDGTKNAIEYDEEAGVNRAILRGCLYNGYCQDAIDIINRRGSVSCSVELMIRKMHFDTETKLLVLDDFYVSGLTLLGANIKPGMAKSNLKLEDFSVKNSTIKFENNNKVVELLESIKNELSKFNKEQKTAQNNVKEGGKTDNMNKFEELLAKYNKTIDDISFEYENLTDDELERKFAEVFENEDIPESAMTKSYEISHEDIRYALFELLAAVEEADDKWYYINNVYDDYFVYSDWDGGKIYGQKYLKDDDNNTVVFDGERYNLHAEYLTDSEYEELKNMRADYAIIQEELNKYKSAEEYADKMTIFDDEAYADYLETDEFKELMSEESINKYSKEELSEKADIIFAKIIKKSKTFSFEKEENHDNVSKPAKRVAFATEHEDNEYKPYGDLFD